MYDMSTLCITCNTNSCSFVRCTWLWCRTYHKRAIPDVRVLYGTRTWYYHTVINANTSHVVLRIVKHNTTGCSLFFCIKFCVTHRKGTRVCNTHLRDDSANVNDKCVMLFPPECKHIICKLPPMYVTCHVYSLTTLKNIYTIRINMYIT